MHRREATMAVAVVLGLAATATTFLDWGRSGRRWRTSYELVDVADRAGVLPSDLAGVASLWYLVPALAGALLLAAALRRPLVAGILATTLGALVGTGSVLVVRSPLVTAHAVTAAVVLGAGTALMGAVVLVTARKESP
jgi:hypothetical protein